MSNIFELKNTEFISENGNYTLKVDSLETLNTEDGVTIHKFTCVSEDGQFINLSLYLTQKAIWKYQAFIKALGHPGEGSVDFDKLAPTLIGRKFIGVVEKQKDRLNVVTGETIPGKYYEIVRFLKCQ